MAAVVKTISLQPGVLSYGLKESKELFGDNFSIFVAFLICSYRRNKMEINLREDEELSEELKEGLSKMQEVFNNIKF